MSASPWARLSATCDQQNIPMSVMLELTHACHLRCPHCYLSGIERRRLPTGRVLELLGELSELGTLFLTLTGGEVTLHPDFLDIARHARRLGMALRIFSMLPGVDAARADAIARLHPLRVESSIFSADPAIHDEVVGRRGAFDATWNGLRLLAERQVPLTLKSPILRGYHEEYPGVIALAESIGAQYRFDPALIPDQRGGQRPLAYRLTLEQLIGLYDDLEPKRPKPPPRQPGEPICAVGRRTMRISPEGLVYPCSTYPHPIGDLNERALIDIWQRDPSPDLRALRALTVADLSGPCSGCPKSSYCKVCPAVNLMLCGDVTVGSEDACRRAEAKECTIFAPAPVVQGGRARGIIGP